MPLIGSGGIISLMQGYGFWLEPRGKGLIYLFYKRHIEVILEQPERFGFAKKELEEIYAKYGEPLGMEGRAREEIIAMAVERGWIRVRRYRGRAERISFNVKGLNPETKKRLCEFASALLNGIEIETSSGKERVKDLPDTRVVIADRQGNLLLEANLRKIAECEF